jgi:uncharacterized protein YegP (UPF0339 family)
MGGGSSVKLNFNPPARCLGEAVVWRIASESREGVYHIVCKLRNGGVICSCEGWQYRGYCKHVAIVPMEDAQDIMAKWRRSEPESTHGEG